MALTVFLSYLCALFGSALLLRVVWRQWHLPMAIPLTLFIFFEILICISNAILLAQLAFPAAAEFCTVLSRRLLLFMPLLWFWLAYEYIRRIKLKPRYIALLLIEPLYVMFIYWLQWQPLIQGKIGPVSLFLIYNLYSYSIVLISIIWIAWHVYRTTGRLWKMLAMLLFLSLFPLLVALYNAQILPYRLGAPMLLLILVPAVLHFRWLAIVPIARDRLADVLTDGVAVLDKDNRIVDANPAAMGLLTQLAGTRAALSYPSPLPSAIQQVFDLTQSRSQHRELDFSALEHPIRYADTVLLPLLDRRQQPIGRLLLLHDVSRRKQAEQERERHLDELESAHRQLQQLDELKTNFFANISHEFRTPLTLSLGPLEDLLDGQHGSLAAPVRQSLASIRHHNQRLLHLINQLLELARLDAGNLPSLSEPINLASFIPQALAYFQEAAQRIGLELHWLTEVPVAWIRSDPDVIQTIISNLLSNALKYTATGGRIEVQLGTAVAASHWQLTVRDSGCGIPPDLLPHIFERFTRQSVADSVEPQRVVMPSSGIGLALVRQLVTAHQGQISVVSTVGQGSRFTVILPAALAPPPHESITPVRKPSAAVSLSELLQPAESEQAIPTPLEIDERPLILVVDDHPQMRDYIAFHLNGPHQVLVAGDGWQGLQLADRYSPDLIVADVMMPGLNGYQFCRQVKSHPQTSHIPIILLTARAGNEDKFKGLEARADDYLCKPFNRRELQARVANLLAQRLQLREYYTQLFNAPALTEIPAAPPHLAKSKEESDFLRSVRRVIRRHLASSDFQVTELALALQLSERQLQRKMNALLGCQPQQLLLEQRLQRAAKLLNETPLSIAEISSQVGFKSPSHFSQKFKAVFQETPTEYRQAPNRLLPQHISLLDLPSR